MKAKTFPAVFLLMAVFIIVGVAAMAGHEMWRDEVQAWLQARDHTSLSGVIQDTRYEKHPLAWFVILFVLSRIAADPLIMQAFHLCLASLSAFLVFKYSPFSLIQKICVVFGYYLLFEYGVISRNYALGVLCLFLFCALYPRFRGKPLVLSLPLFVMANTSVHALIVVIAVGLVLGVEVFGRKELRRRWQSYLALVIIGLGGILAIFQLRPVPDSLFDRTAVLHLEFNLGLVQDVLKLLPRAYIPVPQFTFHFWNTNLLDSLSLPLVGELAGTLLLMLLAIGLLRRKPAALMIYILGTAGLLSWFYLANIGFTRHHGFLFIVFFASLWLAKASPGQAAGPPAERGRTLLGERGLNGVLTVMLFAQLMAGIYALGMDFVYPFSQSKNVARIIRNKGYQKLPIVGDFDYVVSPVSGYLGRRIYYPRAGRLGSYVRWDTRRLPVVKPWLLLTWAERYCWMKDSDCLILMNYSFDQKYESPDTLNLLVKTPRAIVKDEHYSLYLYKHKRK